MSFVSVGRLGSPWGVPHLLHSYLRVMSKWMRLLTQQLRQCLLVLGGPIAPAALPVRPLAYLEPFWPFCSVTAGSAFFVGGGICKTVHTRFGLTSGGGGEQLRLHAVFVDLSRVSREAKVGPTAIEEMMAKLHLT